MTQRTSVIWKYPIGDAGEATVVVPAGAEPLSVGLDPAGEVCVWLACDPEAERVERRFLVRDTGDMLLGSVLETAARFVGTVKSAGGGLMFHVLDLGEPDLDPGGDLSAFDALRRGETPEIVASSCPCGAAIGPHPPLVPGCLADSAEARAAIFEEARTDG